MARRLKRAPSTINRELRRGVGPARPSTYRASLAQAEADRRTRRPKLSKLAQSCALHGYVEAALSGPSRCRPEQISARLRLDFPEDHQMRISHEATYQSLYAQGSRVPRIGHRTLQYVGAYGGAGVSS